MAWSGGGSWYPQVKRRLGVWDQEKNQGSELHFLKKSFWGFPGGAVVENLPADAGDTGSSPGLGGSHVPRSD